jgi:hypothetical protein
MKTVRLFCCVGLLLACCVSSPGQLVAEFAKPSSRSVSTLGVRGVVTVSQISAEQLELRFKTASGETRDTIRGKGIVPLIVNGRKSNFYAGRFGNSLLPMLVLTVRDLDRIQDSRTITYQLTPSGGLIGQRVIIDATTSYKYSDDLSGGRHYLSAIDTKLGAIYSLAYQRASFDNLFITFEKLRVRQWENSMDAFLETDQGFLRDRYGKIMESGRFNMLSERARQQVFVSNVLPPQPVRVTRRTAPVKVLSADGRRAALR